MDVVRAEVVRAKIVLESLQALCGGISLAEGDVESEKTSKPGWATLDMGKHSIQAKGNCIVTDILQRK